jgi:Domain of unknown function (DUF6430)
VTVKRFEFLFLQSLKNVFSALGLGAFLASFGALWLVVEITDYFAKGTLAGAFVHDHWGLFLLLGIAFTLWRCRPLMKIALKLKDRDVTITLAIGDLFSFKGAMVIGSNSTFDVSNTVISEKSIQGQFTKKYYAGESQLEAELAVQLKDLACEDLEGKRMGKCKRYAIGSVVHLRPKDRTGYLLAISDINEHGNSSGTFEKLKQALAELWVFIGHRGAKEPLVMPVLGSGFTRLTQPRQQIVQEIIKSFVAACAERTFCENLIIVLNERDVLEKQIDFVSLGEYLKYVCRYTEFSDRTSERLGTPEAIAGSGSI